MENDIANLGLVDDEDISLDEAALELALADHPETDLDPYYDLLEAIAGSLKDLGAGADTAHARADALSAVLNGEFGLIGDRDTYDDPANADLIRVLDRRRGLPISLSILYVAAARRVGWMASVLNVPGHVLVLVGDEAAPVIVDPFRAGALVEHEQLARLVAAGGGAAGPVVHVEAMTNRAVLIRLLLNQATRAEQAGQGRRALELYQRMTLIAPEDANAWWQRARLELVDGDVESGRASLASVLEISRDPALRERVSETLKALPAG